MELLEELVEEILLRVPPDEPAHLPRASLVCKSWCRILSDRGFLRRYRAFRRTPPLLGYLHNDIDSPPRFVRVSSMSLLTPPSLVGSRRWQAIDCRHGRVLAIAVEPYRLVVWDPVTGDQQHLSVPDYPNIRNYNGAVLCAVDDDICDHLNCHDGPFIVVFIVVDVDHVVRASVYSSETQAWDKSSSPTIVHANCFLDNRRNLLAGGALHFALMGGESVIKYDLHGHRLSVIDTPGGFEEMVMVNAKDDVGLGFVTLLDGSIYLWTQQQCGGGGGANGRWSHHKVISELKTLFPQSYRSKSRQVIGYAEGTYTIFINRSTGIFTLDLKSMKVRMVGERGTCHNIIPYMSFFIPDLAKGHNNPSF